MPPLHRDALPAAGAHGQNHGEGAHVAVAAAGDCSMTTCRVSVGEKRDMFAGRRMIIE